MKGDQDKKNIKKAHTIIISDLHLGSSVSQPAKVLEMLKGYSFKKLILLGDIFDSLDLRDLSEESWALIHHIGKISKEKKVRWIEGNHDQGLAEIFSAFLGAEVHRKKYVWQYKQERYLAIHGHQFDRFLVDNLVISEVATVLYNLIQRLDFKDKKMSHYIKRKSKGWLRLSEKVFKEAMAYGRKHQAKYVFCGHTHKAMQKEKDGMEYYNSGCWTDLPCTYITIEDGQIDINKY